jgi:hypothetical protein
MAITRVRSVQSIGPSHFMKDNIKILSTHLCLGLPSCLFQSNFLTPFPHSRHMPLPSNSSRFTHPSNTWWKIQMSAEGFSFSTRDHTGRITLWLLQANNHVYSTFETFGITFTAAAWSLYNFRHEASNTITFFTNSFEVVGVQDRAVGIATCYGLDGPGIETRRGRDFLHPSRPALWPTHPPI